MKTITLVDFVERVASVGPDVTRSLWPEILLALVPPCGLTTKQLAQCQLLGYY